jgi:hypothetical protein
MVFNKNNQTKHNKKIKMKQLTLILCTILSYMMSIDANAQTVRINGQTNPAPINICKGDSSLLTADANGQPFTTVLWVKNPALPPTPPALSAIWAKDTTVGSVDYTVYLWNGGTYLGLATVTITVKPLPNGSIMDPHPCYGHARTFNVINLTGQSPWTIKMYDDPGMTTQLGTLTTSVPNNPNVQISTVPIPATTTRPYYFVIQSANGCSKTH